MSRYDKYASWQQLAGFGNNSDELVQLADQSAKEAKEVFAKIESFKSVPVSDPIVDVVVPEESMEDNSEIAVSEKRQFGKKKKVDD